MSTARSVWAATPSRSPRASRPESSSALTVMRRPSSAPVRVWRRLETVCSSCTATSAIRPPFSAASASAPWTACSLTSASRRRSSTSRSAAFPICTTRRSICAWTRPTACARGTSSTSGRRVSSGAFCMNTARSATRPASPGRSFAPGRSSRSRPQRSWST